MIATAIAVIEHDVDPWGIFEIRCSRPEQSPLLAAATAEGQGQEQWERSQLPWNKGIAFSVPLDSAIAPGFRQCGISDVLSMAMNQRPLRSSAVNTPELIPKRLITMGTTIGNIIAPARGVMATKNLSFAGALLSEDFRTTRGGLRLRDCCCLPAFDVRS